MAPQRHTSVTCKRLMSSTSTLKGCTFDAPKKEGLVKYR